MITKLWPHEALYKPVLVLIGVFLIYKSPLNVTRMELLQEKAGMNTPMKAHTCFGILYLSKAHKAPVWPKAAEREGVFFQRNQLRVYAVKVNKFLIKLRQNR